MRLTRVHLKFVNQALQIISKRTVSLACTFVVGWLQDQESPNILQSIRLSGLLSFYSMNFKKSCFVWEKSGNDRGSCFMYDIEQYVTSSTLSGNFQSSKHLIVFHPCFHFKYSGITIPKAISTLAYLAAAFEIWTKTKQKVSP